MANRARQAMPGFLAAALVVVVVADAVFVARPARAQGGPSCDALWQERNAIYARNGYCFQTPRAIATFGRGCFPPFGKLYGAEAQRVNELQNFERQRGC